MAKTTDFILNDRTIQSTAPTGTVLLDIIRYHEHLPGTKIGCREGDCGACTVLVGTLSSTSGGRSSSGSATRNAGLRNEKPSATKVEYRSMTSCLLALANVAGKHIVTVEGLNMEKLSPVQQAMVDASGTQCGICTPGFVVSLSGCCLTGDSIDNKAAVRAIDGNICRCTGYKSIERAAASVATKLKKKDAKNPIAWSVKNGFVPAYFEGIGERLEELREKEQLSVVGSAVTQAIARGTVRQAQPTTNNNILLSGGTDLYVQKHDTMHHAQINSIANDASLKGIRFEKGECIIGGGCVVSDLLASAELKKYFANLEKQLLLVSSTPIRNMGTLAGNFVNASPIGDLTAFFIALDSTIGLNDGAIPGQARNDRSIKLKDLYKGYKDLNKKPNEIVTSVRFKLPAKSTRFNFEKVSKRTYLDIASVNTAIRLEMKGITITEAHISAGGVAPVPKYLAKTSAFLVGKSASPETVRDAVALMNKEIAPISDARGTADYKRLLLRQLFFAHFLVLFPERFKLKELVV